MSNPDDYAVQKDGNCPVLEGFQGDIDLFFVEEGKIYLFSSRSARRKFRRDPGRWIPGLRRKDDPEPEAVTK